MAIVPNIIDLNHARSINLTEVKAAGIWGIIHKARQGLGYGDPSYATRRDAAKAVGFLWAAYDFATGDDVKSNVTSFLSYAALDDSDGAWLDFEDNTASQMTGDQAYEFLDRVAQARGRACGIYGGNRIREHVDAHGAGWQAMAAVSPLWQCRYIAAQPADNEALFRAIAPIPPWTANTIIQYTGDGVGPRPHTVAGLQGGDDLDVFLGDQAALAQAWSGQPVDFPQA